MGEAEEEVEEVEEVEEAEHSSPYLILFFHCLPNIPPSKSLKWEEYERGWGVRGRSRRRLGIFAAIVTAAADAAAALPDAD